jgi:hypothetical protein
MKLQLTRAPRINENINGNVSSIFSLALNVLLKRAQSLHQFPYQYQHRKIQDELEDLELS